MKTTSIKSLIAGKSVTMAQIVTITPVKTAAKFKDVDIRKTTSANVQLFSTSKNATVYLNAVKRSASKIEHNDKAAVENFQQTDTYYTHDKECYSIVVNKKTGKEYLYCVYNNAKSEYEINGNPASKEDVAQYLTASEAMKLLKPVDTVYNVKNGIEHDVTVRTISIDNVVSVHACGKVIFD